MSTVFEKLLLKHSMTARAGERQRLKIC